MKILTPLHDSGDIARLALAGAEEFYMGFSDPVWRERFGTYTDLNRCSVYEEANRTSPEDVGRFAKLAHAHGATLYVVMNAAYYGDEELDYQRRYLERFAQDGVDGIIVSTPEQIRLVKTYGMKAVASVMSAVYNSDIARFYRDAGADRIILPRELSTDAIREIIQDVPEPEYEAFFMRNGCRHSDCYCLGLHGGPFGGLCYDQSLVRPSIVQPADASGATRLRREQNNDLYEGVFRNEACGQCALWRLVEAGVSAVKIVGRMEQTDAIEAAVRWTRDNLRIVQDSADEKDYLLRMILPEDRYQFCGSGMSCYYPEVRYR